MTKLIHLDIAALLILVIILFSQFTRRSPKAQLIISLLHSSL